MGVFKCGFLTFLFIVLFAMFARAQSGQDILKKHIPPSPEAASLAKAVEFPVSTFTGSPSINIPIYTIKEGAEDVALSLSYNYNGLKVEEEASWVGLGWTLNAGGAITRVVKGMDEIYGFSHKDLLGQVVPHPGAQIFDENHSNRNMRHCMYYDASGNQKDITDDLFNNLGAIDSEPDLYIYNFNGYSGKFIFKGGQAIDLSNNDIQFFRNAQEFEAVTPNGIHYIFSEKEYTQSTSFGQATEAIPYTFFLSKIKHPYDASRDITFSYVSFEQLLNDQWLLFESMNNLKDRYVPQMPRLNEYYAVREGVGDGVPGLGLVKTNTNVYIELKYLDQINFRNGYIKFDKSPRSDLYGYKLDAIKVYASAPGTNPSLISQHSFTFGYFQGSLIGNDQYTSTLTAETVSREAYPVNYRSRRLKLLSAMENSIGAAEGRSYQFAYEEGLPMPYKSSFAQDYWGYYNGQSLNITLIPDVRRYLYHATIPVSLQDWHGANREPSELYMKQGILKSFTHPTKGATTFDYEIHRYENGPEVQTGLVRQALYPRIVVNDFNRTTTSIPFQEFVIPQGAYQATVDVNVLLYCNGQQCNGDNNITWNCGNASDGTASTLWADIKRWNGSQWVSHAGNLWDLSRPEIRVCSGNSDSQHNYTVSLPPGTYRAYASYPDQFGPNNGPGDAGSATITLDVWARVGENYLEKTGGGLRVKSIINDPKVGLSSTRNYEYSDGVMFRFPMFYWSAYKIWVEIWIPQNGSDPIEIRKWHPHIIHYLYPTTIVPYSYSNGSLVGYQKVTESSPGNGKKVSEYHAKTSRLNFDLVEPEETLYSMDQQYISGVEPSPDMRNGAILREEVYKEGSSKPFQRIAYQYGIVNPRVTWGFKFQNIFSTHFPLMENKYSVCMGLQTCFYPIKSGKLVQTETLIENNLDNDKAQSIRTKFFYDSPNHNQLTRTLQESSDGSEVGKVTLYSKDYLNGNGFIGDLKSKNFILPIETTSYKKSGSNITILKTDIYYYHPGALAGLLSHAFSSELSSPLPLTSFRSSNQSGSGALAFQTSNSISTFNPHSIYSNKKNFQLTYYSSGELQEYEMRDGAAGALLRGEELGRPIAIAKNGHYNQIAFANFESSTLTQGNWTIPSTVRSLDSFSGLKSFDLDNGNISTAVPQNSYLLSYWKKENSGTVSITGVSSSTLKSSITRLGWIKEVWQVNVSSTSLAVIGTAIIDDLRLHPIGAQMTTYTYQPLIGMTSVTDPNGVVEHFKFDGLGRLQFVRDLNRNIITNFEYHYKD